MSSALSTVPHVASLRVTASDEPERFRRLVCDITDDLGRRGLNDRATAAWTSRDNILLAAEVEAMAGVRRVRALYHRDRCKCDPCRITTRRQKISKDPK
ncbi:hypothetical protein ACFVSQ_10490 [Streptomyces niveus]|uniref:hypothetical protein n=1 Tax=Streptomyces niveus TaxID=193462 RepID=UPI0036EDBD12